MNITTISRILVRAISLIIFSTLSATHKIIIQVSPPRCLSTACLRMWQAHGDFEVLNEPFISAFIGQSPADKQLTANWWRDGAPQSYDEAWQRIVDLAEHKPVFVKELGFILAPYLINNPEIIQNPQVHFVFLIRNPHSVIISDYQGHGKIIENFIYLAGFKPCYDIFKMVKHDGAHNPVIICAEDLYAHPNKTAEQLCKNLEIPFTQSMLQWKNLGTSFEGVKEWHELKNPELTHHWHGAAIQSTGFHEPHTYEVDENGKPTFSEVTDENDRKVCFEAYNFNKEYYELFLREKNKKSL
jgi:hypothetical protein